LDGVLGVLNRAEHPVAVAVELVAMPPHQQLERGPIAPLRIGQQLPLGHSAGVDHGLIVPRPAPRSGTTPPETQPARGSDGSGFGGGKPYLKVGVARLGGDADVAAVPVDHDPVGDV
jgi:hypothetical protein